MGICTGNINSSLSISFKHRQNKKSVPLNSSETQLWWQCGLHLLTMPIRLDNEVCILLHIRLFFRFRSHVQYQTPSANIFTPKLSFVIVFFGRWELTAICGVEHSPIWRDARRLFHFTGYKVIFLKIKPVFEGVFHKCILRSFLKSQTSIFWKRHTPRWNYTAIILPRLICDEIWSYCYYITLRTPSKYWPYSRVQTISDWENGGFSEVCLSVRSSARAARIRNCCWNRSKTALKSWIFFQLFKKVFSRRHPKLLHIFFDRTSFSTILVRVNSWESQLFIRTKIVGKLVLSKKIWRVFDKVLKKPVQEVGKYSNKEHRTQGPEHRIRATKMYTLKKCSKHWFWPKYRTLHYCTCYNCYLIWKDEVYFPFSRLDSKVLQ